LDILSDSAEKERYIELKKEELKTGKGGRN